MVLSIIFNHNLSHYSKKLVLVIFNFSVFHLYFPVKITNLYCFNYNPRTEELQKNSGWSYYSLENEFKRMHVPNERWHLTNINESYDLCDTYPRHIYVPVDTTTSILMASSKFRSKGRLPALTYLHPNKASISRCSQPLSGFSARCLEDEQLLEAIRKTNPEPNFMYVVDTRPKVRIFLIISLISLYGLLENWKIYLC